jgi:hypothetical protein
VSIGGGPHGPGGAGPWPEGFRAAVALTFDVDAESVMLASDPSLAARASLMSHQRYGPQTGLPRILRLLAGRAIRATFFVPGYTAEQHPDAILAVRDAGHEIAHHGYLHGLLTGADEAAKASTERGLDALERVASCPARRVPGSLVDHRPDPGPAGGVRLQLRRQPVRPTCRMSAGWRAVDRGVPVPALDFWEAAVCQGSPAPAPSSARPWWPSTGGRRCWPTRRRGRAV